MARIQILDPTATPSEVNSDPGPPLAAAQLQNGNFGIRYDPTWRSFDWVRDEWEQMLRDGGASVVAWCAGDRSGEAGEETQASLEGFVRAQDIAIFGLGN